MFIYCEQYLLIDTRINETVIYCGENKLQEQAANRNRIR